MADHVTTRPFAPASWPGGARKSVLHGGRPSAIRATANAFAPMGIVAREIGWKKRSSATARRTARAFGCRGVVIVAIAIDRSFELDRGLAQLLDPILKFSGHDSGCTLQLFHITASGEHHHRTQLVLDAIEEQVRSIRSVRD